MATFNYAIPCLQSKVESPSKTVLCDYSEHGDQLSGLSQSTEIVLWLIFKMQVIFKMESGIRGTLNLEPGGGKRSHRKGVITCLPNTFSTLTTPLPDQGLVAKAFCTSNILRVNNYIVIAQTLVRTIFEIPFISASTFCIKDDPQGNSSNFFLMVKND